MNTLDFNEIDYATERQFCMQVLMAIFDGHIRLIWGSRNCDPIGMGGPCGEVRYVGFTGPLLRKMTRAACLLADLNENGSSRGQFELILEDHSLTVSVEMNGDPADRRVTMSWGGAAWAKDAARRALERALNLPPEPVELEADESSAVSAAKSSFSHRMCVACTIVGSLFIFILSLPVLPLIVLAYKLRWFEGKKARERRIAFDTGRAAIESLRYSGPSGIDSCDWNGAVSLTFCALVESATEACIETLRQINREVAGMEHPVSAEFLIAVWDRLECLGPASRSFVTRRRFELLEYLGGPIKLSTRRPEQAIAPPFS